VLVGESDVYLVETLVRLVTHFRDYHPVELNKAVLELDAYSPAHAAGFVDICGQEHVKRALGAVAIRPLATTRNSMMRATVAAAGDPLCS
jgi:predicted ATPase with chaperone activity